MSPLPTVAQRPRVSSEELSDASRVSARRQSSPGQREPCSPSPGPARPSALHELPRWAGRCTAQASCWRARPSLPSALRPCSRPRPRPRSRLVWSEGRLILREGTWRLKQQCPSTWLEPPLKWAAVWGSHYPSSRPLGPQCRSCVQPRAVPARPCFLPLSFLGGHSTLNSTLTSAPHSTPRLHFLPGFCYCSSLSELGFLSLVAHECPKQEILSNRPTPRAFRSEAMVLAEESGLQELKLCVCVLSAICGKQFS